ncbi:MAG: hypothetical protein PHT07_23110 [Paludibacter sp.]|nr:hypothetical protein [Paludibacter sp.]
MTPEEMVINAETHYAAAKEYREDSGEFSASVVIARSNKAIYWMLRAIYEKLDIPDIKIEGPITGFDILDLVDDPDIKRSDE